MLRHFQVHLRMWHVLCPARQAHSRLTHKVAVGDFILICFQIELLHKQLKIVGKLEDFYFTRERPAVFDETLAERNFV